MIQYVILSAPVQPAAAATANASITSHSLPININANHTICYCCVDYDLAIGCLQIDAVKGHQLIKFGWSPRLVHGVEGDELIRLYTVKSNSIADLRYAELGLLYLAAAVWCFKSFSERWTCPGYPCDLLSFDAMFMPTGNFIYFPSFFQLLNFSSSSQVDKRWFIAFEIIVKFRGQNVESWAKPGSNFCVDFK